MHAGRKKEEECYFQVRIERYSFYFKINFLLIFEDREEKFREILVIINHGSKSLK